MSLVNVIKTLKKYFGWTDEEIKRNEKSLSLIYYLEKEDILKRANFYMTTFSLTQTEFNKMLKSLNTLLCYNNESVLEKKKNFDKIGLVKNDIIKNPSILSAPSNSLIFKYMLLYIDFGDKSFLDKNWAITSEKKIWARYAHAKQDNRAKPFDGEAKAVMQVLEFYGYPKEDLPDLFYQNPNIMAMDEKVLADELDKLVLQKVDIEEFLKNNPFGI